MHPMKLALNQAKKAYQINEVPIGAVIVKNGKVIGRGYNRRETNQNVLEHAELMAIRQACRKLGSWRLIDCDLYVTLEPCPMCAGAIIQSRIKNVYFGAHDEKAGAAGSTVDLFVPGLFNHDVNVTGGVLQEECAGIIKDFFKNLRKNKEK